MVNNRRLRTRRRTMVAGALILLGAVAIAYQAVASLTEIKTIDVRPFGTTGPRVPDVPPLPLLGAVAIFGGIGLLILESTRPAPLLHHRHPAEAPAQAAPLDSSKTHELLRHYDVPMVAGSPARR